jgi:GATA-binding protein, other eukaryote
MDWRAVSRSRSRISMDWRPTSRSRSRPPTITFDQHGAISTPHFEERHPFMSTQDHQKPHNDPYFPTDSSIRGPTTRPIPVTSSSAGRQSLTHMLPPRSDLLSVYETEEPSSVFDPHSEHRFSNFNKSLSSYNSSSFAPSSNPLIERAHRIVRPPSQLHFHDMYAKQALIIPFPGMMYSSE